MAAASDRRFRFSKELVFDPAVQRLHPFEGKIHIPFLCVNSEEFSMGCEFDMLRKMIPNCKMSTIFCMRKSPFDYLYEYMC